jgi:hypothetical protein
MSGWERIHRDNRYYWVKRDSSGRIIATRTTNPNPGGSGGCFVVTVCVGKNDVIRFYQDFRDTALLSNKLGRWMTSIYYKFGPFLADSIRRFPSIRTGIGNILSSIYKNHGGQT